MRRYCFLCKLKMWHAMRRYIRIWGSYQTSMLKLVHSSRIEELNVIIILKPDGFTIQFFSKINQIFLDSLVFRCVNSLSKLLLTKIFNFSICFTHIFAIKFCESKMVAALNPESTIVNKVNLVIIFHWRRL